MPALDVDGRRDRADGCVPGIRGCIKPAAPDARGMFIRPTPGGRVNITNMTLKELIVIAWRIQPFQISGGPAWLDSVHYDIAAKSEDSSKPSEMPLMLQSLRTGSSSPFIAKPKNFQFMR
jgi:hypothetical protein